MLNSILDLLSSSFPRELVVTFLRLSHSHHTESLVPTRAKAVQFCFGPSKIHSERNRPSFPTLDYAHVFGHRERRRHLREDHEQQRLQEEEEAEGEKEEDNTENEERAGGEGGGESFRKKPTPSDPLGLWCGFRYLACIRTKRSPCLMVKLTFSLRRFV